MRQIVSAKCANTSDFQKTILISSAQPVFVDVMQLQIFAEHTLKSLSPTDFFLKRLVNRPELGLIEEETNLIPLISDWPNPISKSADSKREVVIILKDFIVAPNFSLLLIVPSGALIPLLPDRTSAAPEFRQLLFFTGEDLTTDCQPFVCTNIQPLVY